MSPLAGGDDFHGEALEVAGLRDGNEDGMVRPLGVVHDESGGFLRIYRGIHEVFHEQLAGGVVGAAEGGEQTTSI